MKFVLFHQLFKLSYSGLPSLKAILELKITFFVLPYTFSLVFSLQKCNLENKWKNGWNFVFIFFVKCKTFHLPSIWYQICDNSLNIHHIIMTCQNNPTPFCSKGNNHEHWNIAWVPTLHPFFSKGNNHEIRKR